MSSVTHSTEATRDALKRQHAWRSPSDDARKKLKHLRQAFYDLAVLVDATVPSSRERSIAFTKLEEARMWASNALTLDGTITEDLTTNIPSV